MLQRGFLIAAFALCAMACKSNWKIHGGPPECQAMCKHWGLEFAAMVGVGNQSERGDGATACVCVKPEPTPPAALSPAAGRILISGPLAVAAAQAAIIVAQQEQEQKNHEQQQQQPSRPSR